MADKFTNAHPLPDKKEKEDHRLPGGVVSWAPTSFSRSMGERKLGTTKSAEIKLKAGAKKLGSKKMQKSSVTPRSPNTVCRC